MRPVDPFHVVHVPRAGVKYCDIVPILAVINAAEGPREADLETQCSDPDTSDSHSLAERAHEPAGNHHGRYFFLVETEAPW